MNPNIPPEKILEKYDNLPDDLKTALFSSVVTSNILNIGKKYGLPVDKTGELADETGLVMLGVTPPGEFIRNLTRRLNVEPEKAKAVAEEINQTIFQPVRESLKKVHGLGEVPKTPTPPKKPLPTRSEITEKIVPPELKTPELPPAPAVPIPPSFAKTTEGAAKPAEIEIKVKAIFDEIERKKSRKYAPEIPPIFAKNIPIKDELEADLEKKLSEAKPPQNNYQKSSDPYREPI